MMMREADVEECRAGGMEPLQALQASIDTSDGSYEEYHNGELLAVWGYKRLSFLANSAGVWMLSFAAADLYKVYFARTSRDRMDALLHAFSALRCEVYVKHVLARKWLEWLGFVQIDMNWRGDELFLIMEKERD